MSTLNVFTDGGSKGNPGAASIGGVFYIKDKKIFQFNQSIGIATNNDAEYKALIYALEEIKKQKENLITNFKVEKIEFYSDSRLLVNQVNGFFKVKNGKIKEYILKIRMLEQEINLPIFYHQIPREKNKEADRLVNKIINLKAI